MEKEDLIQFIYDYDKEIKKCIEQTEKDISYKKDLIEVAKKHYRDYGYIENDIKELTVVLRTLKQTQEILNDSSDENNIEIKDIIEYCED